MTTLVLEGYIVKEGSDMKNKLFFYSQKPFIGDTNEFSVSNCGDNVFELELPIRMLMATNEAQKCKITIELEK